MNCHRDRRRPATRSAPCAAPGNHCRCSADAARRTWNSCTVLAGVWSTSQANRKPNAFSRSGACSLRIRSVAPQCPLCQPTDLSHGVMTREESRSLPYSGRITDSAGSRTRGASPSLIIVWPIFRAPTRLRQPTWMAMETWTLLRAFSSLDLTSIIR